MVHGTEQLQNHEYNIESPNQKEVNNALEKFKIEGKELAKPFIDTKLNILNGNLDNTPQKSSEKLAEELIDEAVQLEEQNRLKEDLLRHERSTEVAKQAESQQLAQLLTIYGVSYTIESKSEAVWGVSIPTSEFDNLKEARRLMRKAKQDTDQITRIIKVMRREKRNGQAATFIPFDNFKPAPFVLEDHLPEKKTRKEGKKTKDDSPEQEYCDDNSCNDEEQIEQLTGVKRTNADILYDEITSLSDSSDSISCNGKRYIRNGARLMRDLGPAVLMIRGGIKAIRSLWKKNEKGNRNRAGFATGLGLMVGGFAYGETSWIGDMLTGDEKEKSGKDAAKDQINKETGANKDSKEENNQKQEMSEDDETLLFNPTYADLMLGWVPFSELHHYLSYAPDGEITGIPNDKLEILKGKVQLDNSIPSEEKKLRIKYIEEIMQNPKNKTSILEGFEAIGITRKEIEEGISNQKKGSISYRFKKYREEYHKTYLNAKKEQLGLQTELSIEQQKIMLQELQKNLNDPSVGKIIKKDGYILIEKDGKLLSSTETSGFLLGNLFGQSRIVGEQVIINTVTGTGLFLGGFWDGVINQGKKSVTVTTLQETSDHIQTYLQDGYTTAVENGRLVLKKAGEKTIDIAQNTFNGDYAFAIGEGLIDGGQSLFTFLGDAIANTGEFIRNNGSGLVEGIHDGFTN